MYDQSHRHVGVARAAWASWLAAALLAAAPMPAHAAPVRPNAGSLLQQLHPRRAPKPSKTNTGLHLKQQKPRISTAKGRFEVKHIRITGNTVFSTSTLHALVAEGEDKRLTMGMLERLVGRITDYYHRHGYSLSRAAIPAQTVRNGVILIRVVEARFGKIRLKNQSRVDSRLLRETLSPLKRGRIISDRMLHHSMLLLSDIPGASPSTSLKPSTAAPGSSDLDVNVAPAPLVSGHVQADNDGNAYTGRGRVGADVIVSDPLHLGDALNLNFMTAGRGMDYGRLGYDVVVNGSGTQVGASYSMMHYMLGGALTDLRGYGTADVASAWVKQPLVRSLKLNVYAQAQLDNKRLRDHLDASGIRTDRHLNDGAFSISGDAHDQLLFTGAVNTFVATYTVGNLGFDDTSAAAVDAATAGTAGHFSLWSASLSRIQGIDARDSLYLSASGQWTRDNLDSAEKMVAGGPYSLRGYQMSALSADTSYLGSVELRRGFNGHVAGKVFYDAQEAKVNAKPWSVGQNTYMLSDVGIGLDVDAPHRWHVQGILARPVGKVPAGLGKRTDMRGWVQLSKAF